MQHDQDIREAEREKNNHRINMFGNMSGLMGSIRSMMNAHATQTTLNENYKHRLDDAKLNYNKRVEDAHRRLNDQVEYANRRYDDEISRARQ
jgi:hypothetical protein